MDEKRLLELLLADAVWTVALSFRAQAAKEAHPEDPEGRVAFIATHSLHQFIPEVMRELDGIAAVISEYESKRAPAAPAG